MARLGGGRAVRPCVIIGTDRLYDYRAWFRRPEIILYCGPALRLNPELPRREAEQALTDALRAGIRTLYAQAFRDLALPEEMIPRTAQERWAARK